MTDHRNKGRTPKLRIVPPQQHPKIEPVLTLTTDGREMTAEDRQRLAEATEALRAFGEAGLGLDVMMPGMMGVFDRIGNPLQQLDEARESIRRSLEPDPDIMQAMYDAMATGPATAAGTRNAPLAMKQRGGRRTDAGRPRVVYAPVSVNQVEEEIRRRLREDEHLSLETVAEALKTNEKHVRSAIKPRWGNWKNCVEGIQGIEPRNL